MANEELLESKTTQKADMYFEKYRTQVEGLEKSLLSKVRSISHYDVAALGLQLDQFEAFRTMCEEDGNTNLLGKLPNIALDVITLIHGTSIIPVVASVQPIEEEQGIVYFKNMEYVRNKHQSLTHITVSHWI